MAPTAAQTDWQRIVALYDGLVQLTASPVVQLNSAVAVAMASGPAEGLRIVDELTGLDESYLLPSVRGELLARLGPHERSRHRVRACSRPTPRKFDSGSRLLMCSAGWSITIVVFAATKGHTTMFAKPSAAAALAGSLALFLLSAPGPAQASPTVGCAVGQPCMDLPYQNGRSVVFEWTGDEDFDHYNFRWNRPGKAEEQHETGGGGSGSYTINNVNPNMLYTGKVQGCNTNFLSSSDCTPWAETSFRTLAADACRPYYKWRLARPSDRVCVSERTARETAKENQLANERRSPNGGAYGPNTCKQGFVWREAFNGDVVCVTPQSRSRAWADNANASKNLYYR